MSIFNHGLPPRVNVIQGEGGTDTSKDTVTAETLLKGITAHDAAGQQVTGEIATYDGSITEGAVEGAQAKYEEGVATGKKSEYDAFWDAFQKNGGAVAGSAQYAGDGWNEKTFRPKYDIIVTGLQNWTFYRNGYNGDLVELAEKCGINIVVKLTSGQAVFDESLFTRLPVIDISAVNGCIIRMFHWCRNLHTIDKLIVSENTSYALNFRMDDALVNLTIEGAIGTNDFNVQWSPLSHDSLMSIINALKDYSEDTSGTDWLVTIGSENKAKLTEDEILIAENKGWRVV